MKPQATTELQCFGPGSRPGRTCGTRVALVTSPLEWRGIVASWKIAQRAISNGNGNELEAKPCPRCKRINLYGAPADGE